MAISTCCPAVTGASWSFGGSKWLLGTNGIGGCANVGPRAIVTAKFVTIFGWVFGIGISVVGNGTASGPTITHTHASYASPSGTSFGLPFGKVVAKHSLGAAIGFGEALAIDIVDTFNSPGGTGSENWFGARREETN